MCLLFLLMLAALDWPLDGGITSPMISIYVRASLTRKSHGIPVGIDVRGIGTKQGELAAYGRARFRPGRLQSVVHDVVVIFVTVIFVDEAVFVAVSTIAAGAACGVDCTASC